MENKSHKQAIIGVICFLVVSGVITIAVVIFRSNNSEGSDTRVIQEADRTLGNPGGSSTNTVDATKPEETKVDIKVDSNLSVSESSDQNPDISGIPKPQVVDPQDGNNGIHTTDIHTSQTSQGSNDEEQPDADHDDQAKNLDDDQNNNLQENNREGIALNLAHPQVLKEETQELSPLLKSINEYMEKYEYDIEGHVPFNPNNSPPILALANEIEEPEARADFLQTLSNLDFDSSSALRRDRNNSRCFCALVRKSFEKELFKLLDILEGMQNEEEKKETYKYLKALFSGICKLPEAQKKSALIKAACYGTTRWEWIPAELPNYYNLVHMLIKNPAPNFAMFVAAYIPAVEALKEAFPEWDYAIHEICFSNLNITSSWKSAAFWKISFRLFLKGWVTAILRISISSNL